MTNNNDKTWLSEEAYTKLNEELKELIANRPIIAAEINERREEGDLKENGGYHAARDLQGQQEARIRQLQNLLANTEIGTPANKANVALPGTLVTVHYDDDPDDVETFLLANREQISTEENFEVFSPASPLGTAILNAKVGESKVFKTPAGTEIKVTVEKVAPYLG